MYEDMVFQQVLDRKIRPKIYAQNSICFYAYINMLNIQKGKLMQN
jgi:hypothetical protein